MVLPQFTFQIFSIENNLFKNITNSEHLKDCLNFEKLILAVYHANTIVFSESPRSTVYNAITCEFHSVAIGSQSTMILPLDTIIVSR